MSDILFPLSPIERQTKNHALLCAIGFLVLLPLGALVGRYTRTYTNKWWYAHWMIQFLISGPVIFAGWALGYKTAVQLAAGHFIDPHQKTGLVLLILYLAQLALGPFVHFFKFSALFRGRRPPLNYLHVFLGLTIFVLANFQVYYGLYTEWPIALGGVHQVTQAAKRAWLALVVVFWVLYAAGMGLLPRQFKQERQERVDQKDDSIRLRANGA